MKQPTLGKGKNMSIAKAALVWWFSQEDSPIFLDYGMPSQLHEIVDIAGAEHRSFFTPFLVSRALANSPYWKKEMHPHLYPGIGNGRGNMYTPSEAGIAYYNKHLTKIATNSATV